MHKNALRRREIKSLGRAFRSAMTWYAYFEVKLFCILGRVVRREQSSSIAIE